MWVLTCTAERGTQNGESHHDEIAENVGAPHFPTAFFLSSASLYRRESRATRNHIIINVRVGYSKVARSARSSLARFALSVALSLSRRVVSSPPSVVCRLSTFPSPGAGKSKELRSLRRSTSRRFNGQRTRVSRRRITIFIGRPPPLLTDKCHAARR